MVQSVRPPPIRTLHHDVHPNHSTHTTVQRLDMEDRGGSQVQHKGQVILAPMVRGSELAFRRIARQHGVQTCYSPMLRCEHVVQAFEVWEEQCGDQETQDDPIPMHSIKAQIQHEDGVLLLEDVMRDPDPLVVQLCGNSPHLLAKATNILLKILSSPKIPSKIVGIDLNLGCPQSCAFQGNFGAFLAEKQPHLAISCVAAMKKAIDNYPGSIQKPILSCKIRLMDTDAETISFAERLVDAGCETLAVHCRRRTSKNNGPPDFDAGKVLVTSLPIPVVINGGIQNTQQISGALTKTGSTAVMIASGLLGNPHLMVDPSPDPAFLAAEYLESCAIFAPPSTMYIQKHLRWIFRPFLEPKDKSPEQFKDWRPRLWTFLVRPYLDTLEQFRQVVVLYVHLNESELPPSLKDIPTPTFKSIRNGSTKNADGNKATKRQKVDATVSN